MDQPSGSDAHTDGVKESIPITYYISKCFLSPATRGFAARSHVLARLASLAQIGELTRRLKVQARANLA